MSTCIYGIKNCNTMKKTFTWFDEAAQPYNFHDYKKHGIDADTLARWCEAVGWEQLINKRGTTWRRLSPSQQAIDTQEQAIALMQENTSLIRRPVVENADGDIVIGFDPTRLEAHVATSQEAGQ